MCITIVPCYKYTNLDVLLMDHQQKFEALWADGGHQSMSFTEAINDMRDYALQMRAEGKENIEHIIHECTPSALRTTLRVFRASTQTGSCNTPLQQLALVPDCVLAHLTFIFHSMLIAIMGPSECMTAVLDILPKKLGGCRSVCTFISLWRLFTGTISGQFKQCTRNAKQGHNLCGIHLLKNPHGLVVDHALEALEALEQQLLHEMQDNQED